MANNVTSDNNIITSDTVLINISNQMAAIATDKGTYQVTATILPANATDKSLIWSVTGPATVNSAGLVSAGANGTATVKATNLRSGIFGTLDIAITNQEVLVTSIVLT